jgi:hypothetical protein
MSGTSAIRKISSAVCAVLDFLGLHVACFHITGAQMVADFQVPMLTSGKENSSFASERGLLPVTQSELTLGTGTYSPCSEVASQMPFAEYACGGAIPERHTNQPGARSGICSTTSMTDLALGNCSPHGIGQRLH